MQDVGVRLEGIAFVSAMNSAVPFVASVATVAYTIIHSSAGDGHVSPTAGNVTFLKFAVELPIGAGTGSWFIASISGTVAIIVI